MKIRVNFQTKKYLVLVWFWERKCPPYDGGVNMVVEQYLEDKKWGQCLLPLQENEFTHKKSGVEKVIF